MRLVAGEDKGSRSRLIIISCIEVIKRVAANLNYFSLPEDVIEKLDTIKNQYERAEHESRLENVTEDV